MLLLCFLCSFATVITCLCFVLEVGNVHIAVLFFLCYRPITFLCTYDHSQIHGVKAAPWDLVMRTRKDDVAGATSGAYSSLPTLPPLHCYCCCAAEVVLRSSCVSLLGVPRLCCFTLELGAGHASSDKYLHVHCCAVPPVAAHLKKRKDAILKCIAQKSLKGQARRRHL